MAEVSQAVTWRTLLHLPVVLKFADCRVGCNFFSGFSESHPLRARDCQVLRFTVVAQTRKESRPTNQEILHAHLHLQAATAGADERSLVRTACTEHRVSYQRDG